MGQTPSRPVSSPGRARFMWLCAIGLNISPAQAGATPAAVLRMVRGGSQNPDVAVVPVRSSVPGPPRRDNSDPAPARSNFRFPRELAPRRRSGLRFDSVSANSPAYRDKVQASSGTATGEGFSIARRFASAVCLAVYKVRQLMANSTQSAARRKSAKNQ
jgi:hypothetical protein